MDLAPCDQSAWMSTAEAGKDLLFTEGDLFGWAESLAADTFGDLLDLATGFQKSCNLCVDRIAGFNGRSWFGFRIGCFYTHGCN
jgi:hypothetical protein